MKLAEAPAPADAPPADEERPPALSPTGVSYGLTLSTRPSSLVKDTALLQLHSIVRVLQGPHVGQIGLVVDAWGGNVHINVVEPDRKRRRRTLRIRIETGLRTLVGDNPHLDPKVGDEVWVFLPGGGGQGPARIFALNGSTATVRTRHPDRIEVIDLGPTEPVLEVLFEPVLRLEDGANVSLDVNLKEAFAIPRDVHLAVALGEFLLEFFDAHERDVRS